MKVCVVWVAFATCLLDKFFQQSCFFKPETTLTPAILVSNRHIRKKCTSGKPSPHYGRNKVSFLFGSCASCMNVIYLFNYFQSLGSNFQISFKLIC